MHLPALGIRARMLLLGVLPAMLIFAGVGMVNYLRTRDLLVDFGKEILVARARVIAAEIDRDTLEAVTAARMMATAAANGLYGNRLASLRLTHDVLARYPQFYAAYFGYEPDGDGLDAATVAATRTAVGDAKQAVTVPDMPTDPQDRGLDRIPPQALGEGGRFIPYWHRDHAEPSRILLTPLVLIDGLYYAGCKERFLDANQPDKAMVTEPYDYQGKLMVEHTYPIVIDSTFRGVAGVDRTLDQLSMDLDQTKQRLRDEGWGCEIFLVSRLGKIIATTMKVQDLNAKPIADTPYAGVLQSFHDAPVTDGVQSAYDPLTRESCLYAAAKIPSGGWTVVMQLRDSELVGRVRRPLLLSATMGGLGLAVVAGLLTWMTSVVTGRIATAVDAARKVTQGDLTGTVDLRGSDETGRLLRDVGAMTTSLRGIVSQVKRASIDLNATARQVSAASHQQETAIASLGSSTSEAAVASRQIAVTGQELLGTMGDVASVAAETAHVADMGRENLAAVGDTMASLERSTGDFASRLAAIRQRAEDINLVITTITKVADQTNLLSINAAIEAEKAGEYGQGFIVVAREIRRLADQTAVATLDIERLVEQMQTAVNTGVEEMERFSAEVQAGVERVGGISCQFADVIDKVHGLSARFDQVKEGMQAQAAGAGQITEALVTLTDGSRVAADALREFKDAAAHMVTAADGLSDTVSRFRVDG